MVSMQETKNAKVQKKQRMIVWLSICSIIIVLSLIYFGISLYFKDHFYFRTEINGLKVGGKTVEQAKEKMNSDVGDYLLTIFDRDGKKYHIMGRDIGSEYQSDGALEKALQQQNMFGWILTLFQDNRIDVATPMAYDKEKLEQAVAELSCFLEENIIKPVDATLEKTEEGYEVVPEILGNEMIFEKVANIVQEAVAAGERQVTLTDEMYVVPKIFSDSPIILETLEQLESYAKGEIIYEIADYKEKLGRKMILEILQLGEDYSISFDEKKIADFAQHLATKYNTYGDVREFTTSSGDIVEIGGGDYGWVIDKEKEAKQILEDIQSGKKVKRKPIYSQKAQVEGLDDIGDTYVEIDYTKQHMWYYEDGKKILECDIVSGNIAEGNGSPDGLYKIVYKKSPAVLKGEDYESAVEYFMPFAYNVGIHDAPWRSEFGGDFYKTSGSHGCINSPGKIAEKLYKRIQINTPVIAYYREPIELTAENCRISNAYSYVKPEEKQSLNN